MALCMFNLVLWFYFVILLDTGPNGLMHSTKQERDSPCIVTQNRTDKNSHRLSHPLSTKQERDSPSIVSQNRTETEMCLHDPTSIQRSWGADVPACTPRSQTAHSTQCTTNSHAELMPGIQMFIISSFIFG